MVRRNPFLTQRQGLLIGLCLAGGSLVAACDTMLLPDSRESSRGSASGPVSSDDTAETETNIGTATAPPPTPATPTYANTMSERLFTLARLRAARAGNPFGVEADGPQTRPAEILPAQASAPESQSATDVTYIVKLKDPVIQNEIARNFRRDRAGVESRWQTWRAANGWDGFELVSASYSGEIVVRLADDAPGDLRERFADRTAREIAAWISQKPNVVYCDPNYTASVP